MFFYILVSPPHRGYRLLSLCNWLSVRPFTLWSPKLYFPLRRMYWLSFLLNISFLKLSCAQQFKWWSHVTLVSSCLPPSKRHSIWVSEHRFLSLTSAKIRDAGNHMNSAEWHCKLGVIWGCWVVSVPESMWPSCLLGYPSPYLFLHMSTACMGYGESQTCRRHSWGLCIDKTCLSEIQALLISSLVSTQCTCPFEECLWHSQVLH